MSPKSPWNSMKPKKIAMPWAKLCKYILFKDLIHNMSTTNPEFWIYQFFFRGLQIVFFLPGKNKQNRIVIIQDWFLTCDEQDSIHDLKNFQTQTLIFLNYFQVFTNFCLAHCSHQQMHKSWKRHYKFYWNSGYFWIRKLCSQFLRAVMH